MNTPLMELIKWNNNELLEAKHVIDNAKDYDERIVSMADKYYRAHYQVNRKATELLEKERQIIIDAYHINPNESVFGNVGSDYYTKTFTNESK